MTDSDCFTAPQMKITPLGGLGEIGMNCQLWDTGDTALLIDYGLMFPDDLQMGIDLVIPPVEPILACKDRLRGLILTHGHEDHIGAVPWLVTFLEHLVIYGSPFTLALVKRKLVERDLDSRVELLPVSANDTIKIGSLSLQFISVSHSIPQSLAIAAETPVGKIVHTGDFKIEQHPADGVGTNLKAFRHFAGKDGIRLLLCDSTNSESEGHTQSESVVSESFERIFEESAGRIIITTFSSHIDRIRMVFDIAERYGRKVIVSGRSLIANIEAARDVLKLPFPEELYTDQNLPALEPEKTVILATGSQGEPLSALSRIARGEHRQLSLQPNDTLIMSARVIPGNALAVNRLVNQMYRMGVRVYHSDICPVHVSGHAKRDEIRAIIKTLKPRYFIPIHGEYRHLVSNRTLAVESGITPERAIILEDFSPITFLNGMVRLEEKIEAQPLLIDGKGIGDIGEIVLRERQLMSDEGILVVVLVRDFETGRLLHEPVLRTKGLLFEEDNQSLLDDARQLASSTALETCDDAQKLYDRLRSVLRSFFRKQLGRDPLVVPINVQFAMCNEQFNEQFN